MRRPITCGIGPQWAVARRSCPSSSKMVTSSALQKRAALLATTSSTDCSSVGEVLMIFKISAVAACCSSASASFFSRSARGSRMRLTRALAFVPAERSLRPRVGLFAPLRDKGHLVGTVTGPHPGRPSQGSDLPILTHGELASSLDHLVGAREQSCWHINSNRLGGFEVDHQLVFGRCLHR